MRALGLGVCAAVVGCCVLSIPASAEPIQQNRPLFVNDHDGGITPNPVGDRDFVINPDGDDPALPPNAPQVRPNQDQDENGDIAMYQGDDDDVPT